MSESSHGPTAPAGWYPDPSGQQRYWDGSAWGLTSPQPVGFDRQQPSAPTSSQPSVTPPGARHSPPPLAPPPTWLSGSRLVALIVAAVVLVGALVIVPQLTKGACEKLADLERSLVGASRNDVDDHARQYSDLLRECVDAGGPLP